MTIQEIKEKANDWPGTCIQALCDHVEALEKEMKIKTWHTFNQLLWNGQVMERLGVPSDEESERLDALVRKWLEENPYDPQGDSR